MNLRAIFVSFILIIVTALFISWNYIPYWISSSLSKKIGVDVSISYINLTPFSIKIYDLEVENPSKFQLKKALEVAKIETQTPATTFFKDEITIDKIALTNAYLGLEIESPTNTKGNWTYLIDQLNSSIKSSSTGEGKKKFFIKKLTVDNLNIDLLVKSQGGKIKKIKPIAHMEFNNISSEGEFPVGQLTSIIMSSILKEVFSPENLTNMLKDTFTNPAQGASDLFNTLKSLFSFTDY